MNRKFTYGGVESMLLIGKILKNLRHTKGSTQKEVSDFLKLTPKMISFYENDERMPPPDILDKLANYFNVSTDYLLGRTDFKDQDRNTFSPDEIIPINAFRQIPLLGSASCGELLFAEQNIEDYISFPSNMLNGGDYFALRVKGDSMIDAGLIEGAILIIQRQSTCDNGAIALVCVDKDDSTVKRVFFAGTQIELVPENRKYPRKSYPSKQITIQGVVKKVLADVV